MDKGKIRLKADYLLDLLSVAYLRNILDDNIIEIKDRLKNISDSDIDWSKDVVNSVKNKYNNLINDETVNKHLKRWL